MDRIDAQDVPRAKTQPNICVVVSYVQCVHGQTLCACVIESCYVSYQTKKPVERTLLIILLITRSTTPVSPKAQLRTTSAFAVLSSSVVAARIATTRSCVVLDPTRVRPSFRHPSTDELCLVLSLALLATYLASAPPRPPLPGRV